MNQFFIPYIVGVASSLTVAYFMIYRTVLPLKILLLKQRLRSEEFKKKIKPISIFLQYSYLFSVICLFFLRIGLAMLTGTSAILKGIPLSYIFIVNGLAVFLTFIGCLLILRPILFIENSIFKKLFN